MKRRGSSSDRSATPRGDSPVVGLRIIGGSMRGRLLQYSGDPRTRPMKDRVREAVFNLLGPSIAGTHALDLFAGTGALGLEAISRGSVQATLIERHMPTARLIEQNANALGVKDKVEVVFSDAFTWVKRWTAAAVEAGPTPWTVFCSPPYEFYESRRDAMLDMVGRLLTAAPEGSLLAVEADERFDFSLLPDAQSWDVRTYLPATVGVLRK